MAESTILCILAGGRSSRFGSSKLHLHMDGRPILTHIAHRLRGPLRAGCWLSIAPAAEQPPGAGGFDRIVRDTRPHAGPLAGMIDVLDAAARWPSCEQVVFVPADMPLLTPVQVGRLVVALRRHPHAVGVMAQSAGSRVQPLPCAMRVRPGRDLLRAAWAQGVRGPHRLAQRSTVLRVALCGEADRTAYSNINRPGDLALVEQTYRVTMQANEPSRP